MGMLGCAADPSRPRAFSTEWSDDEGKSMAALELRARAQRIAPGANVVVAVAGNNDKLIGMPLAGGGAGKWSFPHALDARPTVVGNIVVGAGAGEVFALEAQSGKKLWARKTGAVPFFGAGDDGEITVLCLGGATGDSTTLLVVARDGSVKRQIETERAVGVPAVAFGHAFLPWSNQYVSAFDLTSGDEVARVVVRDKVSRAFTLGGGLYFGEISLVRFDDHIKEASRAHASRVALPAKSLPGTQRLMAPGREKLPPAANALDRSRYFARPSGPNAPMALDGEHFYATYFRVALGLDAKQGKITWSYMHPAPVVGGEAAVGGLLLCDERGQIAMVDGTRGEKSGELDLGEPIKSCVVAADSFAVPASRVPGRSLAAQLQEVLLSRDPTLATLDHVLLGELLAAGDESGTQVLIDLATDARSSPPIAAEARAAIAKRRNGAQAMVTSLGRRYDYLHDVLVGPPVGPIAQALAAMKHVPAAPVLATYLSDVSIRDEELRDVAAALAEIGTERELPALKQFFTLYHCAGTNEFITGAVAHAASAIAKVGGKDGRAVLDRGLKDTCMQGEARAKVEALLASIDAAAAAKEPKDAPKPEDKPGPAVKPGPAPKPAGKPAAPGKK
jgi:outer membrane protein assembly factor BamB